MKLIELYEKSVEDEEVEFQGKKISIGKYSDIPDTEFDTEQLKQGTKVEMEHTKNAKIAKAIAKDHIKEDPKYYDKLKKVEGEH